jgi:hypothetical protein
MEFDEYFQFLAIAYEEHNEALLFDLWKSGDRSKSYKDFRDDIDKQMELQKLGVNVDQQARLQRLNSV